MKIRSVFLLAALACGALTAGARLQLSAPNGTPLLVTGSGRVSCLDAEGREVWSVGSCGNIHLAEIHDGWVYYSNGDLWRVRPDGRDRSLVYRPCAKDGLFGFEFQPNGNLVVAENGTSDVVELAAGTTNAVVRFRGDPRCKDGTLPGLHVRYRMVHKTAAGTYLVCCSTARTLREYDAKGALVWEQTCGALVFDAVRRANGNTIISHYDGLSEFTPDHKVVWTFPATPELANFCGLRELPNGDLLVGTYARGKPDGSVTTAFRLTRGGRVVWRLGGPDRNRMGVTSLASRP